MRRRRLRDLESVHELLEDLCHRPLVGVTALEGRLVHGAIGGSPVHGSQEGSAHNGHFCSRCYHPLFCFNHFGGCEGAILRPGNVHSADGWRGLLQPIVDSYKAMGKRLCFRGDAAFTSPDVYEYLEEEGILYAIWIKANGRLYEEIDHLMTPGGRALRQAKGTLP